MDVSFRTILILFYISSISVYAVVAEGFYNGLCANPTCSEPIGQGIAILSYQPGEYDRIRLDVKQAFDIYVKDYGEKKNLLGIMINGQRGYVPKYVVQEQRSFVKELFPATVEFMDAGNQNQEASQIHFSMSHQEVIHHVSPDAYIHEQNYHSNFPPESYGYHSQSGWPDENSHIYASPHVISSHVEATVTSQTSNIAQHPNTWESTSHTYAVPENSVSSYTSDIQKDTYQNVAPQQQYSESTFASEKQQHAEYQNIAPEKYPQSEYPSEYQYPQFTKELQTSFSSQVQSNLQYAQSSQSDQMHTSNTMGNEAQNLVQSPPVEGSQSRYASEFQYLPDGAVSAQYSSEYLKDGETFQYMSSHASAKVKPQIDIPGTIAALKAQGYDEGEIKAYIHGETANLDPSHISYSRQDVEVTNYGYSSQLGHSTSGIEVNQNYGFQHSSKQSQAVSSSEGKADYQPSSTEQFYSSSQFQQSSSVSESSQQTMPENAQGNEEEGDDSGEVIDNETESEIFDNNDSKELPFSLVDEVSNSLPSRKLEEATSPLPQETLQFLKQKIVEETSLYISESNTLSSSQHASPETITESKASAEYHQSSEYPKSSESNFFKDTQEKIVTLDNKVNNQVFTNDELKESSVPDSISSSIVSPNNTIEEKVETIDMAAGDSTFSDTESDNDESGIFFDNVEEIVPPENINETNTSLDKDQNSDLEKVLNISELNEAEQSGYFNAYQIRNLKGEEESKDKKNSETSDNAGANASTPEFDIYEYIENTVKAIRSFVDVLMLWIPEPLYSTIIGLENKGISPRVPVFTALSAIPCLFLIIAVIYVRERSNEEKLIALLASAEKNVYTLSAEKIVLEEKVEKAEAELESCKTTLASERKFYDDLKAEVVNLNQELEKSNLELGSRVKEIETLKEQEKEFAKLIADHEKAHLEFVEEKNQLNSQLSCQDETICHLNDQLQEKDKEIKELQEEKLQYCKANEVYEEKLTQLQQNCNQLLKEAEIWNLRVNELNTKLNEETQAKQQLEESLKTKESEIESLTFLMESFKSFEELEDSDSDEYKCKKR
ncbi:unnamed protein product [Larinioides sclopetarius]|uniref:Transport and Golgi organization protein 1 n=1 Tax=Larinioides sclopetarius TaxID=280406 RepID=A0AAV1ZBU4_9ARAC